MILHFFKGHTVIDHKGDYKFYKNKSMQQKNTTLDKQSKNLTKKEIYQMLYWSNELYDSDT